MSEKTSHLVLSDKIARKFLRDYPDGQEDLPLYTSIETSAAGILKKMNAFHENDYYPIDIDLSGISQITKAGARHLARIMGHLNLSGLKEVSEEVVKEFANHSGTLNLGIYSCSSEAAKAISSTIPFFGVIDMWKEEECRWSWGDGLILNNVEILKDDAAYHLSQHCSSKDFFIDFVGAGDIGEPLTIGDDKALCRKIFKKLEFYADPKSSLYNDFEDEYLRCYVGEKLEIRGVKQISDTAAMYLSRHFGPIEMGLDFEKFPTTEGYLALKKKLEGRYSLRERFVSALGMDF